MRLSTALVVCSDGSKGILISPHKVVGNKMVRGGWVYKPSDFKSKTLVLFSKNTMFLKP